MTFQPPQPPEQPGTPPTPGAPAPGQYTPPPAPQYGAPPPAAPQYGAPPPAAPPQQWQATPPPGAPIGGGYPAPSSGFDISKVAPFDLGIIGAGVLAFLLSFFSWYTVSFSGIYGGLGGFGADYSGSAWNGFFGWFAVLLAVAGAAVVAVSIFMPTLKLPVPIRLVALGAFAVSVLSMLLALVVFPEDVPDVSGIDTGRGWAYWVAFLVIIAGLVLSVLQFLKGGGTLPKIGGMGGSTPPPPPGYPQGGGYTPPSGGYGPPGQ